MGRGFLFFSSICGRSVIFQCRHCEWQEGKFWFYDIYLHFVPKTSFMDIDLNIY